MCNQEEWVSLYKLLIYTIYTSERLSVILLFSVRSSAVTVHFSWLLNLKSAVSWGSNFAPHSLATYLLFPDWWTQAFKFLFIDALNSLAIKSNVSFYFAV